MSYDLVDPAPHRHQSRVLTEWNQRRAAERVALQNATALSSDAEAMQALFQPINTPSGFAVTDSSAVLVSTVFACMSKLAGAITQLPVRQFRVSLSGEREPMPPTPIWWLLNEQTADAWTSASWKEWIIRCIAMRGDQFTQILRSGRQGDGGTVTGFRPLHPDWVSVRRKGDRLVYAVQDPENETAYGLDQDDMLHFTGFAFNGTRSLSWVQTAARMAIGNALAAADYSGRTVGEGAMPKIALTYPNKLSPDQAGVLRSSFVSTYSGPGSQKLPLLLTEGGTAKELSFSPVDMELIAQRQFEREDICQASGVPPILIGDNSKASSWGTGIEQIKLGFVNFTITPLLVRIEEELNRKLFRRAGTFVEFDLAGLLRGDSKAQSESFRAALGGPGSGDGWMSVNEIRRIQNLPALPGEENDKPFRAQRGTVATPPKTEPATEGNP